MIHAVTGLSLAATAAANLNSRQIDLAILFRTDAASRWSGLPLLDERLFVIGLQRLPGMPASRRVRLEALGSLPRLVLHEVADAQAARSNLMASLSGDELSPAGLAARVVMTDVARELVGAGRWPGAHLHAR